MEALDRKRVFSWSVIVRGTSPGQDRMFCKEPEEAPLKRVVERALQSTSAYAAAVPDRLDVVYAPRTWTYTDRP